MRITFITPGLGNAGGSRVIATYAGRLAARGHRVCIVSTARRRPSVAQGVRELLRTGHWPSRQPLQKSAFDGLPVELRQLEHPGPVRDADVPDGDVVVATWWQTAPWVAALQARKGAKAYFMQDYGVAGQTLEQIVPTWSLPLRIITISQWLVDLIGEHVDAPVDLVPNAVDTNLFQTPPRGKQPRPTIGFVYSPYWSKGCDLNIAAAERVRRRLPDLRLVGFSSRLGPSPAFPLPGWAEFGWRLADAALPGVYASCDAWLFGSRLEGFGLPILEAMACRTPVVATKAGAAPELLAGGGGVLVKPAHPDAMAEAIERILEMPDAEWRRMSDAAYATATAYTWDDATTRLEAALERATEQSPGEAQRGVGAVA